MPKLPKASTSSRHGEQGPSKAVHHHPTDPSEAIALGVEAEERGERAAYGLKALRNYQEASRLYTLALRLDPHGGEAADAAYNAGRVLFLIGSSFVMMDRKAGVLEESVALYRRAAELEGSSISSSSSSSPSSSSSSSSPTPFMLDIASNLAAALQAWAETLTSQEQEDQRSQAVALAQEAYHLYDDVVAREQEAVLASQLQEELTVHHSGAGTVREAMTSSDMDTHGDVDPITAAPGSEGDGSVSSHYASSLIVPASLLETYHALHSILLENLLPLACSIAEIEQVSQRLENLFSRASDFVQQCQAASDWGERSSRGSEWAQSLSQYSMDGTESILAVVVAKVDLALRPQAGPPAAAEDLAQLMAEVASLAQTKSPALSALLDPAFKASLASTANALPEARRRDHYQMKVDEIISLTEQSVRLARVILRLYDAAQMHGLHNSGELKPLALAWSIASKASQAHLLVLSLLDPTSPGGAAAVLGTRASANPTTLLRCQLYTSLSSLCLHRADARYSASGTTTTSLSAKSRSTILDNARVYGRRALAEVGLAWVYEGPAAAQNSHLLPFHVSGKVPAQVDATLKEIPPGGWDAVETMGEALLTLARCLWRRGLALRQDQGGDPGGSVAPTAAPPETQAELDLLARSARSLAEYPGWALALDSKRFARSVLLEDEGAVSVEEEQFWEEWRIRVA